MGIHYDYKSTKGNKLMEKQAKREKKLAEKKAKREAKEGPKVQEEPEGCLVWSLCRVLASQRVQELPRGVRGEAQQDLIA